MGSGSIKYVPVSLNIRPSHNPNQLRFLLLSLLPDPPYITSTNPPHPPIHPTSPPTQPQGPSLLLLPTMFQQIYKDLSTSLPEHLDLIKCEPNYVIHYHDGERLELSTDRVRLRREVERFEGESGGEGLEGFLAWVSLCFFFFFLPPVDLSLTSITRLYIYREAATHAKLSHSLVLSKTFNTYLSLLRPSFLINAIALHPLESIWSRTSRYFKTER